MAGLMACPATIVLAGAMWGNSLKQLGELKGKPVVPVMSWDGSGSHGRQRECATRVSFRRQACFALATIDNLEEGPAASAASLEVRGAVLLNNDTN